VLCLVDYCTVDDVKPLLRLERAESSEDQELTSCVVDSTDKVKNLLRQAKLSVPLPSDVSEVPDSVRIAAKNFAAWKYRRRRDPDGAQVFYYDAQEALNGYISAERVAQDGPHVRMV
jgi:hypothetical protein